MSRFTPSHPDGVRVLLVDDLRAITVPLASLLVKHGYHAESVNDSRLAMDTVLRWKPDVILLDINMPYVDGYRVAQSIRSDATTKGIPIIAVTTRRNEDHLRQSREVGIEYQLPKPCGIHELTAMIERAVNCDAT